MTNEIKYPYLRAWGKVMGWPPALLEEHLKLAEITNAPKDAVFSMWDFNKQETRWFRFKHINSRGDHTAVLEQLREMGVHP